jgi:hypothetical protein
MAELTIPSMLVVLAPAALAIAWASLATFYFIGLICADFIRLLAWRNRDATARFGSNAANPRSAARS